MVTRRIIRSGLITVLFLVFTKSICMTEEERAPLFFVVPARTTVYILLGDVPTETEGFNLYRRTKKDKEFIKLTEEPIKPIRDPIEFRSILGDDYDLLKRATQGETEFQVQRRILRDKGLQFAFSFVSLRIAEALGRLYVDKEVEFGKEYIYKVALLNFRGEEFKIKEKSCVVTEARKPKPPFDVKALPDDSQIKVEWKYYELPKEFDYTAVGFNIYRRAESETDFKRINEVLILWQEGHTYRIDYDVENGKSYTYYVTAVDLIGIESEPSKQVSAIPVDKTPPRMPEGVSATAIDERIVVNWKMNLELDLSHYNIYRGLGLLDEFKQINKEPIPGDLPYYEDKEIKPGIAYYYKVQAVDKTGNASRLTSAVAALVEDKVPPSPPTKLKAEVKERKVTLRWEKKPQEEDLAGFYVFKGKTMDDFMRIVREPVKEKTFQDTGHQTLGIVPGATYFYGVSAVDTAYNESERVWIDVMIPDDEPPATPISIYASPTEDGRIEVMWQAAHSWDVAGYRVYRGIDDKKPVLLSEVGVSTFSLFDDKVEKGKKYFYYVTAIDRAKNESKPTERFYVIPTDITVPPAPTNLRAKFHKGIGVKLEWDKVEIDDLSGYRVWRADIPSGVYELLTPKIPVKETKFIDTKGKQNLYYKVSTVDTSGNESRKSDPARAE